MSNEKNLIDFPEKYVSSSIDPEELNILFLKKYFKESTNIFSDFTKKMMTELFEGRVLEFLDSEDFINSKFFTKIAVNNEELLLLKSQKQEIQTSLIDEVYFAFAKKLEFFLSEELEMDDTSSFQNVKERYYLVLMLGIYSLIYFSRQNFLGPLENDLLRDIPRYLIPFKSEITPKTAEKDEIIAKNVDILQNFAIEKLFVDGEIVFENLSCPHHLCVARICFDSILRLNNNPKILKTASWWKFRIVSIHNRLLSHCSSSFVVECEQKLFSDLESIFNFTNSEPSNIPLSEDEKKLDLDAQNELSIRFFLEKALFYLYCDEGHKSDFFFNKSASFSGFNYSITGEMGRRTKYQQFWTAQLICEAHSKFVPAIKPKKKNRSEDENLADNKFVPLDQDSILLEKTRLESGSNDKLEALRRVDCWILLGAGYNKLLSAPKMSLTREEINPFVARVFHDPLSTSDWMLYTLCLLMKTRVEMMSSKTVERATLQKQILLDSFFENKYDDEPFAIRFPNFFISFFPSIPSFQQEIGRAYMSLGVIKTAINHFLSAKMYTDAIEGYIFIDEKEKAMELIEKQINAVPPLPNTFVYWCLKGDALNDPKCYEKAWEISKFRYARAQRALGTYYFQKEDFVQAAECFRKALHINAQYSGIWFALGVCGIKAGDHDGALNCFLKVVNIEQDNVDAWNNISTIYIKRNENHKAIKAIQEGLKVNSNLVHFWENLLFLSMTEHEFGIVFHALQNLIQQKVSKEKEFPQHYATVLFSLLDVLRKTKGLLEEKDVIEIKSENFGIIQKPEEIQQQTPSEPKISLFDESEDGEFKDLLQNNGEKGKDEAGKNARLNLFRFFVGKLKTTLQAIHDAIPTQNPTLWELFGTFYEITDLLEEELDVRQKHFRAVKAITGWESDPEQFAALVASVEKLMTVQKKYIFSSDNMTKKKYLISSARMTMNPMLKQAKNSFEGTEDFKILEKWSEDIKSWN